MAFPFLSIAFPFLSVCTAGFFSPSALAQLQPDNTLGEENSVVTPNINIKGIESDRIDGGAQRGANLFHSFQEFNIQQGRGVYFSNPDGVQNILTRVTGNNGSNILGTLGVDGKADLFFINPNGIIFGPEAKLDVQGSFYGATADSILFKNGFEFASSDPQAPPLLTVNVPIGLRLPEKPGSILVEGQGHNINVSNFILSIASSGIDFERTVENRNRGLEVSQGKTLGLVGGDIFLRGGNLTSDGGRVELGSVQNGVVGITTDHTLSYDQSLEFGQILLSEESSIDVSGNGRVEFEIQGEEINVQDSSIILARMLGDEDGGNSIKGWISNSQGIELITNPETTTPASPWLMPPNCKQLESQQPPPYLLASSKGNIPTSTSEPLKVTIKQFNFEGNTKFSNQELQQQLTPYQNKPITFAQLMAARTAITKYYTKNNYITSGAFIPPQTMSDNGTLTLRVVEGKVDEINVNIQGRLNENYIKSRLEKATTAPLNQEKLVSALQLLQIDPLVKTISAELSSGVRPDTSRLDIRIETANPWQIETISNNGRAPSVGTFRRGVEVGHRNVTGIGDSFNALYTNTDGSDMVEVSYSIPLNSSNGRMEIFYRHRDNKVVESPFKRLDIESNSNTYKS